MQEFAHPLHQYHYTLLAILVIGPFVYYVFASYLLPLLGSPPLGYLRLQDFDFLNYLLRSTKPPRYTGTTVAHLPRASGPSKSPKPCI